MNNNVEELAEKLRALRSERDECMVLVARGKDAMRRLDELNDATWGNREGEITKAAIALRDASLPVVPGGFRAGYVILSVDDKFITLVSPGFSKKYAEHFRRSDGREKGSRSEWRGSVDVEAIVKAWEEHNVSQVRKSAAVDK